MDADYSHDPKDLLRMNVFLDNDGYDVVIGSRYVSGVNVVNWPIQRVLLSYFASIYARLITGVPVKDLTSGFVGYKVNVLKSILKENIRFNGYAFQIEMKFKAHSNGFKLIEIPIIFTDRTKGESKMSLSIVWEAIFGLLLLKIKKFLSFKMKILIKNGYIVNENKIFESDILVNGELIEKIDKKISSSDVDKVIDCEWVINSSWNYR